MDTQRFYSKVLVVVGIALYVGWLSVTVTTPVGVQPSVLRSAEGQTVTGIVDLPTSRTDWGTSTGSWLGESLLGYIPWDGSALTSGGGQVSMFILQPGDLVGNGAIRNMAWRFVGDASSGLGSRAIVYGVMTRIGIARSGWSQLTAALEQNFDDEEAPLWYHIGDNGGLATGPGSTPPAAPSGTTGDWMDVAHQPDLYDSWMDLPLRLGPATVDPSRPTIIELLVGGQTTGAGFPQAQWGLYNDDGDLIGTIDAGGWEANTTTGQTNQWAYGTLNQTDLPPQTGQTGGAVFPSLRLVFTEQPSTGGNQLHGGGGGSCFLSSAVHEATDPSERWFVQGPQAPAEGWRVAPRVGDLLSGPQWALVFLTLLSICFLGMRRAG